MAILFSCPYCTASVKVPDVAAGKTGACPKCGTKVRVPHVEIPASAPPAVRGLPPTVPLVSAPVATRPPTVGVAPPAPSAESGFPDLFAAPPVPASPPPIVGAVPPAPLSANPFDFSTVAPSPMGGGAASGSTTLSSAPKKRAASRKPVSGKLLAGIAVGLLILAGVGVWTYIQNLPVHAGAVTGARVPGEQAITVTVPWTTLEITGGVQGQVIEYFKRHQTSLANNLLKIDLSASPQGLTVRFSTTEDSMLVSVDPHQIPDIDTLITKSQDSWGTARESELKQFAQELCTNVAKAQATGVRVESMSGYRDTVALNALVRGLGRHCVAVAHKTTHPCVFEDEQGLLYFAVPEQVREIIVIEKSGEGRPRQLPAEFEIRVAVPPRDSAVPRFESPKSEEGDEPATSSDRSTTPGDQETAKPPTADEPPGQMDDASEGEMKKTETPPDVN